MIEIQYIFSKVEMSRARAAHWKYSPIPYIAWIVVGVLFASLGIAVIRANTFMGSFLVVYGIYCVFRKPIHGIYFFKQLKSSPDYGKEVRFSVSESSVDQTVGGSAAKISWNSLYRVRKAKDGYLLYLQKNQYLWLPTHSLSEDDQSRLAEIVESNTTSIREPAR